MFHVSRKVYNQTAYILANKIIINCYREINENGRFCHSQLIRNSFQILSGIRLDKISVLGPFSEKAKLELRSCGSRMTLTKVI